MHVSVTKKGLEDTGSVKIGYVVGVAIVGSAMAVIWWREQLWIAPAPSADKPHIIAASSIARSRLDSNRKSERSTVAPRENRAQQLSYKRRFEQSSDYWQLANQFVAYGQSGRRRRSTLPLEGNDLL